MHINHKFGVLLGLMLVSPLICAAAGVGECGATFDYQLHHQLIESARRSHQATPVYGRDPQRPGAAAIGFNSELEAVTAAVNLYNPPSMARDREYMGAVLERHNHFYYTVGEGKRGEDSIELRLLIPAGFSIVAFWHTHGAPAYKRKFFSETDQRLVRLHHKPFYLADFTGSLRVLRPADKGRGLKASEDAPRHRNGFLRGLLVHSAAGVALNVCTSRDV